MSLSKDDLKAIRELFLEAFDAVAMPQFEAIHKKLNEHDEKFDRVEAHLTEHDKQLAVIEAHLTEHDRTLTVIRRDVAGIDGRLQAVEADVKELYRIAKNRGSRLSKLKPEERVRQLYADVQALARQLNVEL